MIKKEEFFNQFNAGQNQYTYFIMAVDASALAFALNKIDEKTLTLSFTLFALSILTWAVSFLSGIRFQQLKNEGLSYEYKNTDIRGGDYPGIGNNQVLIESECAKLLPLMKKIDDKMNIMYNLLNYCMILGMVFFTAYQLWEMILRA